MKIAEVNANVESFHKLQNSSLKNKKEVELKKLKDSCRDFESIMVQYMMKNMKVKDELLNDSYESDIYQDMFIENLSKEISDSQAFNLKDILYKQYSEHIEKTFGSQDFENKNINNQSTDLMKIRQLKNSGKIFENSINKAF